MTDDFSNLKNLKGPLFQPTQKSANSKTSGQKSTTKLSFIITKKKNNSWVDDLHAQTDVNQRNQVYH